MGNPIGRVFGPFHSNPLFPTRFMPDRHREAILIGITGGIACGKSEVGGMLRGMGFATLDADDVARDMTRRGTPVFGRIVDHFGERIVSPEGELDRSLLGGIVFRDERERRVLNDLVHPAVREAVAGWIAARRAEGARAAVMIPLLFECGMESLEFDAVVCVSSSREQMLQRLAGRGLGRDEAMNRICSQMPLAEKERRADYTVPNFGTLGELECAARQVVAAIHERKK